MAYKKLEQPTIEEQQEENSLVGNLPDVVKIPGTNKSYKIEWLRRGAIRKFSSIMAVADPRQDDKVSCKVAACIVLNDKWKIAFFYAFLWRWFYYIKQYGDEQLLPIIEMGKKKIPQQAYYIVTILAIGMMDTIMTMKKEEVNHTLHEQVSGQGSR